MSTSTKQDTTGLPAVGRISRPDRQKQGIKEQLESISRKQRRPRRALVSKASHSCTTQEHVSGVAWMDARQESAHCCLMPYLENKLSACNTASTIVPIATWLKPRGRKNFKTKVSFPTSLVLFKDWASCVHTLAHNYLCRLLIELNRNKSGITPSEKSHGATFLETVSLWVGDLI